MSYCEFDDNFMSEKAFMDCYIQGLKNNIKLQVQVFGPVSLNDAYVKAIDIDSHLNTFGTQITKERDESNK